ncbi:phosphoribosylformylglycinamidine synthase subunit PurQ [Desulfocicer niacini]
MKAVNALVLTGFGLNCDMETAAAFELAGAKAHRVHINALIAGKVDLDDFQILAFGGGFSWGDDHGAGVIQSLKLKNHMGEKLLSFVDQGKLIIGICNGFQTLVNLGLLPGFDGNYTDRSVALTWNDCGNFRDQWVHLGINDKSPCVFTKGLERVIDLPVRHGEGKFVADTSVVDRLEKNNQVVMRYALGDGGNADGRFPENPNGSMGDIAGICDPTGRVFGLMPHPEAFNHFTNHPDWCRELEHARRQSCFSMKQEKTTSGIRIFINAVKCMSQII